MMKWLKRKLARFGFTVSVTKTAEKIYKPNHGTARVTIEMPLTPEICDLLLQKRHDTFQIQLNDSGADGMLVTIRAGGGALIMEKEYRKGEYKKQTDLSVSVDGASDHFSFDQWIDNLMD